MTPRNFFELVKTMRENQRNFFRTKSYTALSQAMYYESLVDKEIERVQNVQDELEIDF